MWDVDFIHGRIAEIRRLDPEFRLFGAREHRHRLNPPLSTEEILAFEKRMGVELPAAYRTFLATVGNGGAGPHYGLFGLAEALREDEKWHEGMPGFYATPFPHTTNWNPRFEEQPIAGLEFGRNLALDPRVPRDAIERQRSRNAVRRDRLTGAHHQMNGLEGDVAVCGTEWDARRLKLANCATTTEHDERLVLLLPNPSGFPRRV